MKEGFERRHPDATVEWTVPDNGLNRYIEQRTQGVDVDADLYLGLNVDDLIRADRTVEDELFVTPERDAMENADALRSELEFDPEERIVPYDTGYISLVYDEDVVDEPETLDALLEPEYEGALLAQNAQSSDPARRSSCGRSRPTARRGIWTTGGDWPTTRSGSWDRGGTPTAPISRRSGR